MDEVLSEIEEIELKEEQVELEPLPQEALISALLFSSPKPLTLDKIAEAIKVSEEEVERLLEALKQYYREDIHGFTLETVGGGYVFRTSPRAANAIRRVYPPKLKKLSRAAAETLAVIAYKQPVQRAEVEAIRGVDALPTLKTLLDMKLIRIVGHDHSAGQPALYGTTEFFLEKFGLNDLSELPSVRELKEFDSDPGEPVEESTNEE